MPMLPDIEQVDETDAQFERVLAWLVLTNLVNGGSNVRH